MTSLTYISRSQYQDKKCGHSLKTPVDSMSSHTKNKHAVSFSNSPIPDHPYINLLLCHTWSGMYQWCLSEKLTQVSKRDCPSNLPRHHSIAVSLLDDPIYFPRHLKASLRWGVHSKLLSVSLLVRTRNVETAGSQGSFPLRFNTIRRTPEENRCHSCPGIFIAEL